MRHRHRFLIALWVAGMMASDASAAILYRISGISDFNLPNWSIGDPGVTSSMDICVHSALGDAYTITALAVPGFVLTSGLNTLAYSLRWEDSGAGNLGSNGGTALSNAVTLLNRQNANTSLLSDNCSTGAPSGATARLYISITQAALMAAPAGTYNGTLTLTVSPI